MYNDKLILSNISYLYNKLQIRNIKVFDINSGWINATINKNIISSGIHIQLSNDNDLWLSNDSSLLCEECDVKVNKLSLYNKLIVVNIQQNNSIFFRKINYNYGDGFTVGKYVFNLLTDKKVHVDNKYKDDLFIVTNINNRQQFNISNILNYNEAFVTGILDSWYYKYKQYKNNLFLLEHNKELIDIIKILAVLCNKQIILDKYNLTGIYDSYYAIYKLNNAPLRYFDIKQLRTVPINDNINISGYSLTTDVKNPLILTDNGISLRYINETDIET